MKVPKLGVDYRNVVFALIVAVLIRLFFYSTAQNIHADAVTRVFLTLGWMENPHYIFSGYWGPLHTYLTAVFIQLFNHIDGPKLLNVVLSSLTVIPLYGFTRSLFKSSSGALAVSLIYVLSPIVLRNSFLSLAGISYCFFTVSSMYFLLRALRDESDVYAVISGLALTMAAATRYEAWVIIAAFTLVGILHGQVKRTAVFWLTAMLFPVSWMIGNHIEYGDFLYSVSQNDIWNVTREGLNDSVNSIVLKERLLFFPLMLMASLNPIIVFLTIGSFGFLLWKKRISRIEILWLLPFLVLAIVFMQKAYEGTFMLQSRFVLTWIILFLPFVALVFRYTRFQIVKSLIVFGCIASLIPMSSYWVMWRPEKTFGKNEFSEAIDNMILKNGFEFEAIPRLHKPSVEHILGLLKAQSDTSDGVIIDSFGWEPTHYLALHSKSRPYLEDNAFHSNLDVNKLIRYLKKRPEGYIILSRYGLLAERGFWVNGRIFWKGVPYELELKEVFSSKTEKLFNYSVIDQMTIESNDDQVPIKAATFPMLSESEHLEIEIRRSTEWFNKVRRSAFWSGYEIDVEIDKSVNYVLRERKSS